MHSADKLQAIIAELPTRTIKGTCFRVVDFSVLTRFNPMMPLYTLGPGLNGQRYTPKAGPPALYVAEDLVTAQAEYAGVAREVLAADPTFQLRADPTVQLTLNVRLDKVLDVANPPVQQALGTNTAELTGPWRKQMIRGLECPTHILAIAVFASGEFQAMRYPSARAHDRANLIIWEERLKLPSFVEVSDSTGTLSARIPP